MRAGRLRHRVRLERKTTADDGAGGVTETWAHYKSVYAAVIPLAGQELFAAQQVMPRVSHRVELRYDSGVTADMRVNHRDRILDIQAVLNIDERDRETHLLCEELR